jgi:hypothetical protein
MYTPGRTLVADAIWDLGKSFAGMRRGHEEEFC